MKFDVFSLGEIAKIRYGKNQKNVQSDNGDIPIYGTGGLMGYASRSLYNYPSVLIGRKGTIGKVSYVEHPFWTIDTLFYTEINKNIVIPKFLYYLMSLIDLNSYDEGTTIPSLRTDTLNRLELRIPSIDYQKKILSILDPIYMKIQANSAINKNLEEQAFAVFDNLFANTSMEYKTVGSLIIPKRGKNLLSKDAVFGDIPVVAGGLEPSTYHNIPNTASPVITISASGANAGFVRLWNTPVWASDSSFIDTSVTKNVFFWYVILKKHQKEIFDSQTGSAQPHIYPKHIAEMKIPNISEKQIIDFDSNVSPLFKTIGINLFENKKLAVLRDTLLPRLMSGELDVSNIDI